MVFLVCTAACATPTEVEPTIPAPRLLDATGGGNALVGVPIALHWAPVVAADSYAMEIRRVDEYGASTETFVR